MKLFFVNAGGYRPTPAELHEFGLFAASDAREAKEKALKTLLRGAWQQHKDNLQASRRLSAAGQGGRLVSPPDAQRVSGRGQARVARLSTDWDLKPACAGSIPAHTRQILA